MRYAVLLVVACLCQRAPASVLHSPAELGDDVIVTTENGALRGVVSMSWTGQLFNSFLGIPFAAPPVGDLRFRVPQPPSNWSGVRDALSMGPVCCQGIIPGSEDCLYLNVYAPQAAPGEQLPVMFHIYGGGFGSGFANMYLPGNFIDRGVILVTSNYRVGSMGFLSLQNEDIPGNAGLKDQVMALKWVQRNIAAFGGDPNQVTVFGQSAGGCSTSHLFLSPAGKGLFNGVIMESGVATAPWGVDDTPRDKAYRLAASLGFQAGGANDTDVDARLAAFLRSVDSTELTRDDSRALSDLEKRNPLVLVFLPVLEPESDSAVVTEMPADVIREGRYNQVAIVVGVTSGEGGVVIQSYNESTYADLRENFTMLVGNELPLPTENERRQAAERIERFYFGDEGFNEENMQAVTDVFSDMYFIYPADVLVRGVANTSSLPVYFYYYDYDDGNSPYGAPHVAEAAYLFYPANASDEKVANYLRDLWTNVPKYGDPAPNGNPVVWERYTPDVSNYLDMKDEFLTRQNLLKERMTLWRELLHS